jgi:hypothetical protein
MLIMQGANALLSPMFSNPSVSTNPVATASSIATSITGVFYRGVPTDLGLLNQPLAAANVAIPVPWNNSGSAPYAITGTPPVTVPGATYPQSPANYPAVNAPIYVSPTEADPKRARGAPPSYQENAVAAIAQGVAALAAIGQVGPYALVLHPQPWADVHSPLKFTLILPAIPIEMMVTAGHHMTSGLHPWTGSAALPAIVANLESTGALYGLPPVPEKAATPSGQLQPPPGVSATQKVLYTGVLLSLGGHPFDLVRCRLHENHDALVTFEQKDTAGNLRFRVRQRFALRIKDITAAIPINFLSPAS